MSMTALKTKILASSEIIKPISDAELQGCGDCLHYDPCGPHLRTDTGLKIRCKQDRINGLTSVAACQNTCPHRVKVIYFNK